MKGMLFKPELVQAIAEGRKTVTRRLHEKPRYVVGEVVYIKESWNAYDVSLPTSWWHDLSYPFYSLQDKIKMNWTPVYKRNEPDNAPPRWISPLIMPEFLAALRIRITEVKQERLQDITREEAVKEGVKSHKYHDGDVNYFDYYSDCYIWRSPVDSFRTMWDSISTRPGTRWADNPLVYAYSFEVINV